MKRDSQVIAIVAIIIIIVILALLYRPSDTPPTETPLPGTTPNDPYTTPAIPSDCYGFLGGEPIVTTNHCLQSPYSMDTSNPIIQAVPEGWSVVNILENADGVQDEQTDYAGITDNGFGLTYELHNGLHGIDGQWGYAQDVELDPGCYLGKVAGMNKVNDPPHYYNFTLSWYVDGVIISQQVIPAQSGFELIYPFEVTIAGEYNMQWMVEALWGTAGHGSNIDILGAGVLSVEDGYCSGLE